MNYLMVWNQCVPPENDDFIMHSELNKRADFLQLSHWLYKAERLNYNFLKLMLKMITCITVYECISTL